VVKAELNIKPGEGQSANLTLTVGSGDAAKSVNLVGVNSTADLAQQINSNSAKLGLQASLDSKGELTILSATGENITFGKITGDASISLQSQDSQGNFSDKTTVSSASDAKTAVGYVQLNSSEGYALTDAKKIVNTSSIELDVQGPGASANAGYNSTYMRLANIEVGGHTYTINNSAVGANRITDFASLKTAIESAAVPSGAPALANVLKFDTTNSRISTVNGETLKFGAFTNRESNGTLEQEYVPASGEMAGGSVDFQLISETGAYDGLSGNLVSDNTYEVDLTATGVSTDARPSYMRLAGFSVGDQTYTIDNTTNYENNRVTNFATLQTAILSADPSLTDVLEFDTTNETIRTKNGESFSLGAVTQAQENAGDTADETYNGATAGTLALSSILTAGSYDGTAGALGTFEAIKVSLADTERSTSVNDLKLGVVLADPTTHLELDKITVGDNELTLAPGAKITNVSSLIEALKNAETVSGQKGSEFLDFGLDSIRAKDGSDITFGTIQLNTAGALTAAGATNTLTYTQLNDDGQYPASGTGYAVQAHTTAKVAAVTYDVEVSGASELFGDVKADRSSVSEVDISTADGAQRALAVLDSALAGIDAQRADLGAVQNRFDNTINNLQNIVENASAARSRITDTDYAAETATLSKNQVLQQAGTAILAQAKQLPQAVLSLLQ